MIRRTYRPEICVCGLNVVSLSAPIFSSQPGILKNMNKGILNVFQSHGREVLKCPENKNPRHQGVLDRLN